MKILVVTGGAGFVGTNLIKLLLQKTNYKIISLDNYSTGNKKNHVNNNRVKYIKGNTKEIFKILKNYQRKIHTIFHFGEFSRIFASFVNKKDCLESNSIGTLKVIQFSQENNIKLIYSATSASLGNNSEDKHLSPYAFSKAKNLDLIINFNIWFGLKYEIIYFYNVYGPHQIMTGKMAAVIGIFETCIKENKKLPIVFPGTQKRNFTHVEETVNTCYVAWKKNKNSHYSISAKNSTSILQISRFLGAKTKFVKERKGERFKSCVTGQVRGIKINNLYGKMKLRDYRQQIKKN